MPLSRDYQQSVWFGYLDHGMKDLVNQSFSLLDREEGQGSSRYHDYSFLVFPTAKAYEGFVKRFVYDLGLISKKEFESRHFRVGKSLNPDLPRRYRDEDWLYDDLKEMCRHKRASLVDEMWDAWREGRNLLFHYFFPDHKNFVNLLVAREKIEMMTKVMDQAVSCGILGEGHA